MEPFRNIFLAGLGALGYGADKAKSIVQSLVERGELTRTQGEELLAEWIQRGKEEKEKLGSKIGPELQKMAKGLGLASRQEFEALEKRVADLEQRLPR